MNYKVKIEHFDTYTRVYTIPNNWPYKGLSMRYYYATAVPFREYELRYRDNPEHLGDATLNVELIFRLR